MTPDLCKTMKTAGCERMMFGVESGNDEILKKINKMETKKQIETGISYARKAGITIHNCVMFGFPWDTIETIKQTYDFACKLNAEFTQFAIATPLPGTKFYEIMKAEGCLIGEDWERDSFRGSSIKLKYLTKEQVDEFVKKVNMRYYFRPEYLLMMTKWTLKSKYHFSHMIRVVPNFLKRKKSKLFKAFI
jgi:radical SAM superfamily enzyme YgiQ (UPF0313 family)